ncbi:MAG TPA: class I fructose-bisphosphate aldolase [Candidatus Paceibacterota bacterium]|nr:class I fructose-bisphosphate aldolase [Candidatus Paceibacterota bacterium]
MTDLADIAKALFAAGKGLLAADESVHTATKRLAEYGIAAGEDARRKYRELFLGAPGAEEFLSGVILFTETLAQKGGDGELFPDSLSERGIAPGVKVDEGTEPFPSSPDEFITNGLIGLPERLAEYKKQGALFTKWRAVVKIDGDRLPTPQALHENAKRLASYAKDVQAAELVPILEPEVLLDGAHSRQRAKAVIKETMGVLFSTLEEHAVDPSGLIIKTAMALSGSGSGRADTPEEIAEDTVAALMESVPKQVAGIVFLSGGQTPDEATKNLAAISRRAREASAPWPLTFSYARALQEEALAIWKGKEENVLEARAVFMKRLKAVSEASRA